MSKERISIIGGTGDQGKGLALRWALAGHEIVIGSRDGDRARATASEMEDSIARLAPSSTRGPIRGASNSDAASASPIVVLTVPFSAQIATLKDIRGSLRSGSLFLDVTVPLEPAVGGRRTRMLGVWAGSAAEQAAELLPPEIRIVSAFQNVAASVLADLEHDVECDIIVCGDDKEARESVRPLVDAIQGCRYIDGGVLANSRLVEIWTAMLIGINIRYRTHSGIRITGIETGTK